jgi:hypothetical protein
MVLSIHGKKQTQLINTFNPSSPTAKALLHADQDYTDHRRPRSRGTLSAKSIKYFISGEDAVK